MPGVFPFQIGDVTVLDEDRIEYEGRVWTGQVVQGEWCTTLRGGYVN